MKRSLTRVAAALVLTASMSACGTIMHGTSQDIGFQSSPSSAKLTVDGILKGQTPAVVPLARKRTHIVRLELDGYQPYEATITKSASGWVWGNIVFGGIIGLVVDAASGGLYKLSPEQVAGQMGKRTANAVTREGLYVRVVMAADPSWEKVGQMRIE